MAACFCKFGRTFNNLFRQKIGIYCLTFTVNCFAYVTGFELICIFFQFMTLKGSFNAALPQQAFASSRLNFRLAAFASTESTTEKCKTNSFLLINRSSHF